MIEAEKLLLIERDRFRLTLWDDPEDPKAAEYEKVAKYEIAVAADGYVTPRGVWRVTVKQKDPDWWVPNSPWAGDLAGTMIPGGDPRNPLKERWIGFTGMRGVGIHGTADLDSIGSAASHGCIRMRPKDVIELYDQVPIGCPVVVI